jgi:hypothetical protein
MVEVMNIKTVKQWFGNRGYVFNNNSKLKYKVINIKGSRWIFIHDLEDEFDEVEVYCMDLNIYECHNSWNRKGFSWSKRNLIKLAKEEIKYEH